MKIDMSPEAVTNRMRALDQLWELAVALKSSRIEEQKPETIEELWEEDKAHRGKDALLN